MTNLTSDQKTRQAWMGLLAKAQTDDLGHRFSALTNLPDFKWLQPPEIGAVMVRGRMGGIGAPFNLGEMSVTRCALMIASGEVGHAYVQGRSKVHAEQAAMIDALMQTERADEVRAAILVPIAASRAASHQTRAEKAAATKVDFFTLVRGED